MNKINLSLEQKEADIAVPLRKYDNDSSTHVCSQAIARGGCSAAHVVCGLVDSQC